MSNLNWPEGATHHSCSGVFYRYSDGEWQFHTVNGWRTSDDWSHRKTPPESFTAKPATWSGPQDGLPPVNTLCEYWNGGWERCIVVAHLNSRVAFTCPDDRDCERVYIESSPSQHKFRAIKTAEQLAAEQRETAIREFMDIVGIDCRVTASKAVDAGFKREVV